VKKYPKKSLTLAFSRHIIGVVPEQKKYTGAKKEQKQKFEQKLHRKRPFLAGGRFYLSVNDGSKPIKKPDFMPGAFIGGAGGYRTRVQMVTYYSSTSLVSLDCLTASSPKSETKMVTLRNTEKIRSRML
jgi:hypothetical protein